MTKSLNKRIIGLVIGSTVAGVAKMASTEKGRSTLSSWKDKALDRIQGGLDFIQGGIKEMKQLGSGKKPSPKTDKNGDKTDSGK